MYTGLTSAEITTLTNELAGEPMGRLATVEKTIGRFRRFLEQRLGAEDGFDAARYILDTSAFTTALERLRASLASAMRAADLAAEPKAAANEASWAAIPDHGTASGAARAAVKDGAKPRRAIAAEGPPAARITRKALAETAADAGELPEPPDFSAATHARFRKKLAEVAALIAAGDIDGLRAYPINPVSSSPKALDRYRTLAIRALEARRIAAGDGE